MTGGVVLLALGSRGDVQPMAALAGGLMRQGTPATVVALREYADVVRDEGAGFAGVDGELSTVLARSRTLPGRVLGSGQAGQGLLLRHWVAGLAEAFADAALRTVHEGDLVLTGVLTRDAATALAEAHRLTGHHKGAAATLVYTAQLPTGHRESHYVGDWFTRWDAYNRAGTRLNWQIASTLGAPTGDAVRRRLGLARPRRREAVAAADRHPVIVAASPLVVPPADDWGPGVHQTGHLAGPARTPSPTTELTDFLDEGEAPYYVGFGSFTGASTAADIALIVRAAELSGRRVLTPEVPGVATGRLSARALAVPAMPHDWLFGRVSAVVHHGGAGATHDALRAGVPSAAIPFGVDQPYHARRLHTLGVGPAPVPIRRLTADRLAALLTALDTDRYRARAAAVGAQLRREDGVGDTIALLRRLALLPEPGRESDS